jgi:hypothetical protein
MCLPKCSYRTDQTLGFGDYSPPSRFTGLEPALLCRPGVGTPVSPHFGHSGISFVQKFDVFSMNQIYKTMVPSEMPDRT